MRCIYNISTHFRYIKRRPMTHKKYLNLKENSILYTLYSIYNDELIFMMLSVVMSILKQQVQTWFGEQGLTFLGDVNLMSIMRSKYHS